MFTRIFVLYTENYNFSLFSGMDEYLLGQTNLNVSLLTFFNAFLAKIMNVSS